MSSPTKIPKKNNQASPMFSPKEPRRYLLRVWSWAWNVGWHRSRWPFDDFLSHLMFFLASKKIEFMSKRASIFWGFDRKHHSHFDWVILKLILISNLFPGSSKSYQTSHLLEPICYDFPIFIGSEKTMVATTIATLEYRVAMGQSLEIFQHLHGWMWL